MVGRILWDIFQIIFVVSLSPLIISVVCNGGKSISFQTFFQQIFSLPIVHTTISSTDSHNGAILRVKNHATENDTLVLTCFYEHKDNVTSEWIFPKGSTAKNVRMNQIRINLFSIQLPLRNRLLLSFLRRKSEQKKLAKSYRTILDGVFMLNSTVCSSRI